MYKFELGNVITTPGAFEALAEHDVELSRLLKRHQTGDYGDVGHDEVNSNELAILNGSCVWSVYALGKRSQVWVITWSNRQSTLVTLSTEWPILSMDTATAKVVPDLAFERRLKKQKERVPA